MTADSGSLYIAPFVDTTAIELKDKSSKKESNIVVVKRIDIKYICFVIFYSLSSISYLVVEASRTTNCLRFWPRSWCRCVQECIRCGHWKRKMQRPDICIYRSGSGSSLFQSSLSHYTPTFNCQDFHLRRTLFKILKLLMMEIGLGRNLFLKSVPRIFDISGAKYLQIPTQYTMQI